MNIIKRTLAIAFAGLILSQLQYSFADQGLANGLANAGQTAVDEAIKQAGKEMVKNAGESIEAIITEVAKETVKKTWEDYFRTLDLRINISPYCTYQFINNHPWFSIGFVVAGIYAGYQAKLAYNTYKKGLQYEKLEDALLKDAGKMLVGQKMCQCGRKPEELTAVVKSV